MNQSLNEKKTKLFSPHIHTHKTGKKLSPHNQKVKTDEVNTYF